MKKFLAGLFATLILGIAAQAQSFYDLNTVQNLEIFFSQTNWDYQLDTAKAGAEGYVLADSVRVNGQTFIEVGVKYKGNSSYNASNNKNPLHINLDYIHGNQNYQSFTDIKLGNGFSDPSNIREVLSYDILRKYMDCPLSNFMNVYVNGSLRGLYTSDESINKRFLANHYYDSNREFFKCNPVGGAGPQGGTYPDLVWQGADSSLYADGYELKSDYGWNQLVRMIDTLSNHASVVENTLDIDRVLWMLAFNNVLVNLDSYSGTFKQNYYLYKDLNGRWVPTVWDLNMSFGGFPGGGQSVSSMQNMIPLYSNDASHPLIQKLMAIPQFKKMYIAHMRTIANENFANGYYTTKAAELMATIDADVNADPYKFYTYTQFLNSITTNVSGGGGPGGGTVPGISVLMNARNTYLQSTTEFTQTPPTISSIGSSPAIVTFGNEVFITATVSNASSVFLGYRFERPKRFFRYAMYDDGAHGDGSSGDGVYGASFTIEGGEVEYYIYAENSNAGVFSPERAEHEFYSLDVQANAVTSGTLVINELLADNSLIDDEYGESDDWLELFNTTDQLLDLSNLYLSDTISNLMKWQFPAGATLDPNGYLVVWTDDDAEQLLRHTNFKLNMNGGHVYLSNDLGEIIDSIAYPAQATDISYGHYPNGTGPWGYMLTTIGASNEGFLSVSEVSAENQNWTVFPNPCSDLLNAQSNDNSAIRQIKAYDVAGRIVHASTPNMSRSVLETAEWPSGFYTLTIQDANGNVNSVKVVKE
jgi:CotH kinase protein/Lamin Tail Domain/Secretion system C-terminal sorting domain